MLGHQLIVATELHILFSYVTCLMLDGGQVYLGRLESYTDDPIHIHIINMNAGVIS